VISVFCCGVDEISVLLRYYTAYGDQYLPTFQENTSISSSTFQERPLK